MGAYTLLTFSLSCSSIFPTYQPLISHIFIWFALKQVFCHILWEAIVVSPTADISSDLICSDLPSNFVGIKMKTKLVIVDETDQGWDVRFIELDIEINANKIVRSRLQITRGCLNRDWWLSMKLSFLDSMSQLYVSKTPYPQFSSGVLCLVLFFLSLPTQAFTSRSWSFFHTVARFL